MADHSISDVHPWEIWQVDWPHDDGTSKARPALAISVPVATSASAKFLYITSEDHPEIPCRLKLDARDTEFKYTGLTATSWIHFLSDMPLDSNKLQYRRGHINALTAVYLASRLKKHGVI